MAFAVEQTTSDVTGTTSAINIPVSATKQYSVVCVYIAVGTTETATGVTDNAGNTYVLKPLVSVSGTVFCYLAYGVQVTAGATQITVSFSGSSASKRVFCDEYSGVAHSNAEAEDVYATATGSGTAISTVLTPSSSGKLVVVFIRSTYSSNVFTAGAGYTLYGGVNPSSQRSMYRLASTTSETCPATTTISAAWAEFAIAFNPAPAAPTGGSLVNKTGIGLGIALGV